MEDTAFAGLRFYPNGATMQFNYFFAMRQPNARTFIHGTVMQPLENNKDALLVLFFYTNAIIAELKMPVPVFFCCGDIYMRCNTGLLKFNGVADKILK